MSEQPGQGPVIKDDSRVTVASADGREGTVMWIEGGEAKVVFEGGHTMLVPVDELKLAEEER